MSATSFMPWGEAALASVDDGDDLDEAERERLHAALRRSGEQLARGEGIAAEDALRRLHEP